MIRLTGLAAGCTPTAHPAGTRSLPPATTPARNSRTRSEPPLNRAASLLSTTQIRQVSGRCRNRGASTTTSLSLYLSVSLARTRASGSTARPSHCRERLTSGARSRASAVPSFSGPLHQLGAGIPAGTDEMSDVRHLLSHGASWRRFDFLGFTHICAKDRRGRFKLSRVTSKKRKRTKLAAVKTEMRRRMHHPIPEQGRWLARVLQGHYNYYAVPHNSRALSSFHLQVKRHWLRSLRRRSQRHRMSWERLGRLADRWLPRPRIMHPWPNRRFDARTQGRSPVR